MSPASPTAIGRQRGTTLLEALIAFLVLSLGILTIGRVQTQLRLGSDIARQRAEAVRLGQEELENLRAFSVVAATAGARSYAEIAGRSLLIDADAGYATNTRYRLTRAVQAAPSLGAKDVSVDVAWSDRSGQDQHIALHSVVAAIDPKYAGALAITPTGRPVKGAFGRSPWIPLNAQGSRRRAQRGEAHWRTDFGARLRQHQRPRHGHLLGPRSHPRHARSDFVCPGGLRDRHRLPRQRHRAVLVREPARCRAGSRPAAAGRHPGRVDRRQLCDRTVVHQRAAEDGGLRRSVERAVSRPFRSMRRPPRSASPAGPTAAIVTSAISASSTRSPMASGRATRRSCRRVGRSARHRARSRVCRFAADLDGSGAVDANVEHPAHYIGLSASLANQNFLVITGSQVCPGGGTAPVTGVVGAIDPDLSTVQHQP